MQVSGTFPQLSDNQKKSMRKMVQTRSAVGMMKGGALGQQKRLHTGSTGGNRARARVRAGRKG